jgi:hypothetical protein
MEHAILLAHKTAHGCSRNSVLYMEAILQMNNNIKKLGLGI